MNYKENVNLIWNFANLLHSDYKQSDYRKIILLITILRYLDCIRASVKQNLLDYLLKFKSFAASSTKDLIFNNKADILNLDKESSIFEKGILL